MFPAALHEGPQGEPPNTASLAPKHNEAPWAPEDAAHERAAHERAAEQEKARRLRNAVRTPPPLTRGSLPCATCDTSLRAKLRQLGKSLAVRGHRLRI